MCSLSVCLNGLIHGVVGTGSHSYYYESIYRTCLPFIICDDDNVGLVTPVHIKWYRNDCTHPIGVDQCDVKVLIICHCFL